MEKAELESKIAGILAKNYLLPINSMENVRKGNEWCDNIAKEIATLFQSQLKSELIAYDKWLSNNYCGNDIVTPEREVDEYLKQKK